MIGAIDQDGRQGKGRIMRFVERRPFWSLVIFLVAIILLWAIFAVWPKGHVEVIGR